MNSFELNKILGAILGTCLITLALNIAAGAIFAPEKPAKPGYEIAVKEEGGGEKAGAEGAGSSRSRPCWPRPRSKRARRSPSNARPATPSRRAARTGSAPISGISSAASAAKDRGGFNFSAAMKAKGGNWTFDELYKFLTNPRGYIPGTNMTFAGLSRGQQRADVIDFLHTLSDNPVPLPKAAANAPAPAAAHAGRGAAAKPARRPRRRAPKK